MLASVEICRFVTAAGARPACSNSWAVSERGAMDGRVSLLGAHAALARASGPRNTPPVDHLPSPWHRLGEQWHRSRTGVPDANRSALGVEAVALRLMPESPPTGLVGPAPARPRGHAADDDQPESLFDLIDDPAEHCTRANTLGASGIGIRYSGEEWQEVALQPRLATSRHGRTYLDCLGPTERWRVC